MDIVAAIKAKDDAAVRALLAKDASVVRATTPEGLGILQLALYYRASRVVDALLEAGASPNVWEAATMGDTARVRALISQDETLLHARAADGGPPLHYAAHFGHAETVKALLSMGADVRANGVGPFKNTALHAASAAGHTTVAEILLNAGADVNATDHHGYVALHNAAANGVVPLAELLLTRGAKADVKSNDGKTPLDVARDREHPEVAALLS